MRQRKAKDLEKRLAQCSGHMVNKEDGSLEEFLRGAKDLYVEIGCGKGQFIIKKAAADPDSRFLAIEGQETVILRAAEKAMCVAGETEWPENVPGAERMEGVSAKLDNLKFINCFIDNMGDLFEENQLSGLYLNFSDPWPKARHAKRRLTYHERLQDYAWAIKDGGFIEFKTDNDDLLVFTLEEIAQTGELLHLEEITASLHAEECRYAAKDITTEYEDKFVASGKSINYVRMLVDKSAGRGEE
ncbi:MAG: tRNA (guanosine(46)-N7)-methyltransferase TrmB [Lachnospiraceae bacterium]|nr:tRNA (guanosine(46)-N7)-methyltransferase TrmB [Lachnospiraceae bacterium]